MKRVFAVIAIAAVYVSLSSGDGENQREESFLSWRVKESLGTVKAHTTFVHKIKLANPFDDTFSILRIDSSCRCTDAKVSKDSVNKDEAFVVSVKIKAGSAGDFRQSIVLDGRVGQQRAGIAVVIEGTVKADLVLENPQRAWTIRTDVPGEASALDLRLQTHWNNAKWNQPVIHLSHPSFKAKLISKKSRNEWIVRITPLVDQIKKLNLSIMQLTVSVKQDNSDGESRHASASVLVRKARLFQAVIPTRIGVSSVQPFSEKQTASTAHLHVYFNAKLLQQPLEKSDFVVGVRCANSDKSVPLDHQIDEITDRSIKCLLAVEDIRKVLDSLACQGFDEERRSLGDVTVGNLILTHRPSGSSFELPLFQ